MFKTISKLTAGLLFAALLTTSCTKDNTIIEAPLSGNDSPVQSNTNLIGSWGLQTDQDVQISFNPDGSGVTTTDSPLATTVNGVSYTSFDWVVSDMNGEAPSMKQLDMTYPTSDVQTLAIENVSSNEIKIGTHFFTRTVQLID